MRLRASRCVVAVVLIVLSACGDDDSPASSTETTLGRGGVGASSVAPSATASASTEPQRSTSVAPRPTAAPTSTGGTSGGRAKLPDGCTLVDDATAAAAMGAPGTKASPQAPTEISTRCEWKSGTYSISLLVRQGEQAGSSYGNAAPDFVPATISGADGRVRLGVRESARNYRLVTFLAFDGTYYVSITLQGPDRDDPAATEAAASLVRATLAALPG